MAGDISGVLKEIEPKALFTHCHGHALNLAILLEHVVTHVRNMFNTLNQLHSFFNGSKRNAILKTCIANQSDLSSGDHYNDTRWICRYAALKSFEVIIIYTNFLFN